VQRNIANTSKDTDRLLPARLTQIMVARDAGLHMLRIPWRIARHERDRLSIMRRREPDTT
jgi:hypothetical protein